jgi:Flp pilus assembly pilin Flp
LFALAADGLKARANEPKGRKRMKSILMRLWKEEEGQDLLEYALLITLIVLVAAAAINPLGNEIANVYTKAQNCISSGSCT